MLATKFLPKVDDKKRTFAGIGQIGEESFRRRRGRDQLLDELPVRRQLLDQDERVERIPDVLLDVGS